MLNYKYIHQKFSSYLEDYFKAKNFTFKASEAIGGYYVYKKTEYGNELIEISVVDYKVEFGLCASFMVCYTDVTKIWQNARGLDEEFNLKYTFTLIHDRKVETLSNYTVSNELDIKKWCKTILIPYFEEYAQSFFEKYDNLNNVDKVLNSKPVNNSQMAQIAIIVAKLNNNPNFSRLVELYYQELKKQDILYEYPNVVNYLKSNEFNLKGSN